MKMMMMTMKKKRINGTSNSSNNSNLLVNSNCAEIKCMEDRFGAENKSHRIAH